MASHVTQGGLIFQDENFVVHHKNAKTKSSRAGIKKGGNGFGSRKALNDITNKSSIRQETSSRKKNLLKEKFNIADEMFLHDHNKCIEAQQKAREPCILDIVLPGHDSFSHVESPETEKIKGDPDSPSCYPERLESELADWLVLSTPPSSPVRWGWDSPPLSPMAWKIEPDFMLKKEDDD